MARQNIEMANNSVRDDTGPTNSSDEKQSLKRRSTEVIMKVREKSSILVVSVQRDNTVITSVVKKQLDGTCICLPNFFSHMHMPLLVFFHMHMHFTTLVITKIIKAYENAVRLSREPAVLSVIITVTAVTIAGVCVWSRHGTNIFQNNDQTITATLAREPDFMIPEEIFAPQWESVTLSNLTYKYIIVKQEATKQEAYLTCKKMNAR